MANTLGRISGQMLKDNLTRNGTDLKFDTDLLYLNVNSRYVGVNTDTPSKPLFVNGEFNSTNFITTSIDGITSFNLDVVANSIISQNDLNLVAGTFVFADSIHTDNIGIDNNSILTLNSDSNLELRPDGTGTLEVQANTKIYGNLTTTGNITLDGNITFGDTDTDNITLLADVDSDIIPDQNEVYDLGTNQKRWEGLYPELINGQQITSFSILSGGLDLTLRQGNIWYVASNGNDGNVGDHQNGPFATIGKALSEATAGDTVFIYPGTYTEITPLTIPAGVTVKGAGLRSVTIIPDSTTTSENVFLLNGETTVSDLTIKNFYYDSVDDTGYAFSFAPGFTVTSRSPYVQNITVITQGTTITVNDPRGFDSGDAGKGAKIDGSLANAASVEASMLFHSCTFICPGVDAITMLNGVRVEWLNSFTYYANRGLYALNGTAGFSNLGLRFGAEIRSIGSASVYGNYGAEANGSSTLMYLINHNFAYIGAGKDTANDPSLNIAGNETVELGSGKIYYQSLDNRGNFRVGDAFAVDFETGRVTINGVTTGAGAITSINFASGVDETVIDAAEVLVNNIRFSGNTLSSIYGDINLDSATNQLNVANNVAAINDIDITGDFTVDGMLTIGNAYIDVVEFIAPVDYGLRAIIDNTHSLGNNTTRWGDVVVFDSYIGNLKVSDSVITTLDSNADLELRAAGNGRIYIPNDNTEFNQTLTVNGTAYTKNVTVAGNIDQIGNTVRTGNTVQIGNLEQTGNQTITGRADYSSIEISGNLISSTNSNSNLELIANGTGKVYVPYSDVQVLNDFTVDGLLDGTVATVITSTTSQTYSNSNISISTNIIETTTSNSDLELRAAGTGRIYISQDNVKFDNDLTVNGTTNLTDTNITGPLNYTGTTTHTGNYDQIGNRYITGDLNVSGSVDFGDIEFINNRILTTRSNSNLELRSAGNGVVKFVDALQIDQAATFPTLITNNITNSNTITSNIFYNGNIEFYDNNLRTLNSNSDLVFLANNLGTINLPLDPLEINQNFTVTLTSTLKNTDINGLLTHIGQTNQTGNNLHFGNFDITGNLTVNTNAYFENINVIDNLITTVASNSNLELKAAGTGIVIINDSLNLGKNLSVNQLSSVSISNSSLIISEEFTGNDIVFKDNYITTTQSNSNLELIGNGVGGPKIEKIKFNSNVISTDSNNDNIVFQSLTSNTIFNTVSAIKLPSGTTAQRTLAQADLRFNTTETLFNGFSSAKVTFAGVYSADQRTSLTAHPINNTLNFIANLIPSAIISSTGLTVNGLSVDNNTFFNNNSINALSTDSDIFFTANGTGQTVIDNLGIRNNELTNLDLTQPLILQNTGFGYVEFGGTGGLVIPSGDNNSRPTSPEVGDIRWNTQDEQAEVFNGTEYQSFQGETGTSLSGEDVEDVTNLWALILG